MTATTICPAGSSNAQSGELGDQGDFGLPITPPHDSQKNLVKVGQDPRTGVMLAVKGTAGAFSEDPVTNPILIRSTDCGRTWEDIVDLIADDVLRDPYGGGAALAELFFQPAQFFPGVEEGEWFMMDYAAGYYFSEDDGDTWTSISYAGIEGGILTPPSQFPEYHGILGVAGQFDTRALPVWHYLAEEQIGYVYQHAENSGKGYLGIRRSVGPNASSGWEDSMPPDSIANSGTGWIFPGAWPVLHGANGRWITIVDEFAIEDFNPFPSTITPNVRINTNPNLASDSWQEPFWLVSEAFMQDIYQGTAGSPGNAHRFTFRQGHPRLKFIPLEGHTASGRWWFMGVQDLLLFSDNNGNSWDLSLSDHTEAEETMHPFLNWRRTHNITTRFTTPRVLDIVSDPFDQGRLISVGVTYDREGITNRLAVFSCSSDGGDTWGPVGQLPISLDNLGSNPPSNAGGDSPAVARHIFRCL